MQLVSHPGCVIIAVSNGSRMALVGKRVGILLDMSYEYLEVGFAVAWLCPRHAQAVVMPDLVRRR